VNIPDAVATTVREARAGSDTTTRTRSPETKCVPRTWSGRVPETVRSGGRDEADAGATAVATSNATIPTRDIVSSLPEHC